jgi:NADH-quinone oxidoreductase subunit G
MGALTSKPYSFAARPWELTSVISPNHSEPFGSMIKFDLRGNNIMRVLPVPGQYKVNDWISDYTRFSYDGFSRQRIENPFVMTSNGLVKSNWNNLRTIFDKLIPEICESPLGLIGNSLSIEEIKYFDKWIANKNGVVINSNYSKNADWRESYSSKDLRNGEFKSLTLFVEFDPKVEVPALNTVFQQAAQFENIEFFSIGAVTPNQNYNIKTISNDMNTLIKIANGSHAFCKKLIEKNSIDIIVKSDINKKSQMLINFFVNSIKQQAIKVNINYLSLTSGIVNFFELARTTLNSNNLSTTFIPNWAYSTYSDEFDNKNLKLVYQGSNGDKMAENAMAVLPSTQIIERNGSYLNSIGHIHKMNSFFTPTEFIRSFQNTLEFVTKIIFMKQFKSSSFINNEKFNISASKAFDIENIIQKNNIQPILFNNQIDYSNNMSRRFMTNSLYRDSITRSSRFIAIAIKRFTSDLGTFNINI